MFKTAVGAIGNSASERGQEGTSRVVALTLAGPVPSPSLTLLPATRRGKAHYSIAQ